MTTNISSTSLRGGKADEAIQRNNQQFTKTGLLLRYAHRNDANLMIIAQQLTTNN